MSRSAWFREWATRNDSEAGADITSHRFQHNNEEAGSSPHQISTGTPETLTGPLSEPIIRDFQTTLDRVVSVRHCSDGLRQTERSVGAVAVVCTRHPLIAHFVSALAVEAWSCGFGLSPCAEHSLLALGRRSGLT